MVLKCIGEDELVDISEIETGVVFLQPDNTESYLSDLDKPKLALMTCRLRYMHCSYAYPQITPATLTGATLANEICLKKT